MWDGQKSMTGKELEKHLTKNKLYRGSFTTEVPARSYSNEDLSHVLKDYQTWNVKPPKKVLGVTIPFTRKVQRNHPYKDMSPEEFLNS